MPRVYPEYKTEAKSRILRASLQAFSEKGYDGTTMNDVAKRLGVSKGALYLYFKSKGELFKEICELGPQILVKIMFTSFKDGDLLENAETFFNMMLEQSVWTPNLSFEILSESSRNPTLKKMVKQNYDKTLNTVRAFLEEQKRKGVLKRDLETHQLAMGLVALFDGLMASLLIGTGEAEAKQAWNQTVKAMLHGTLTRASP
ncbi:MAG: TetR/AcrR family transcriptional regulator [Thaumarchaeota archaeon]|nr:TetR/AcrR family transcriptional regulator [Nitrososphaerota archaeon]